MRQISSLTSSLGANLVYERNEFGELLNFKARQEDAENHFVSEHRYDSLGFELERMLPGGISQSFAYDNIGRFVDSKTRQSSKVRKERKYHWGKADRLLKTEDSRYGTTSYEYSATGHLQKATYADGREEYRLSDKVSNLFDDPERKLRKYLQGGKIEQSGEWHFEYDKDGQLTEKHKGSGKWWDTKHERWQYEWSQNGTLKAVKLPHRTNRVEFTYDALGSTGSGKSWCVAKIIEQIAKLPMANSILFDIHGEYSGENFKADGIQHFRIANPSDLGKKGNLTNGILMLPYWLLTYEEMLAMLLDRSDSNAPNQAMLFSKTVFTEKQKYLDEVKDTVFKDSITIDSPIPYKLEKVLQELKRLDEGMVPGAAGKEKQGPFFGKLTRFIQRLEAKKDDKRIGFLFQVSDDELQLNWLNDLCSTLMHGSELNGKKAGVKIIDFSEVPSDVLPLVIGLVARIIFTVQQWTTKENQHPICLLCDEAHLYIPERTSQDAVSELSLKSFERIAKEGRKYGVSLVVISQRPAEVNRTVLSQCNNFISLRLSNAEDQTVIKRLLPNNLAGLTEVLPILDIGEALVVGDASLLPTRILISESIIKPDSATIKFWKEWSNKCAKQDIANAVIGLRKQSKF